jgi:hypothetical protein
MITGKYVLEQAKENLYHVYNLESGHFVQPENVEAVWSSFPTEAEVYCPLPKLPWRPLPLPRLEPVSAEQLYREIRHYIYAHVDFTKPTCNLRIIVAPKLQHVASFDFFLAHAIHPLNS